MISLVEQVKATVDQYGLLLPEDTLVLGISGGPDSLCLLHVLRQLADDYGVTLHAAHLHHGIRGQDADDDARFVQELCRSWGVPHTVERADVPGLAQERGMAIEEAARQARYGFLGSLVRSLGGRSVAVAHNADDQVETVLMHFLRGAGLAGLRGMRALAWMDELRLGSAGDGPGQATERIRLIRPLLEVPRQDIEAYCQAHDLQPRFDRSNLDQTYFRNRLRHELIPHLKTYNPNVSEVVRRMARVLSADYDLLRQLVCSTWPEVVRHESDDAIVFDLAAFRAAPLGLRRSLLREAIHRLCQSLRNINWVHIDDALRIIERGDVGAMVTLPRGLVLILGYTQATLGSEGYELPGEDWPRLRAPLRLPVPGSVRVPDSRWTATMQIVERQDLPQNWDHNPDRHLAYLDASSAASRLTLRTRREGDWFIPLGLSHRQKLGDFMINRKIPLRERSSVPLLLCGDDIAWVVGWHLDARYAITPRTRSVLVVGFRRS